MTGSGGAGGSASGGSVEIVPSSGDGLAVVGTADDL